GLTQAKVKGSLGSHEIYHMCGSNNCCRGQRFQTYSGDQNFVVGGQIYVVGRDLIGFDLGKGSTS
ncbi:hypothetical protein, partial [Actinobacillus pleuropneumoniae]